MLSADIAGADIVSADIAGAEIVSADIAGAEMGSADIAGAEIVSSETHKALKLSGAEKVRAETIWNHFNLDFGMHFFKVVSH